MVIDSLWQKCPGRFQHLSVCVSVKLVLLQSRNHLFLSIPDEIHLERCTRIVYFICKFESIINDNGCGHALDFSEHVFVNFDGKASSQSKCRQSHEFPTKTKLNTRDLWTILRCDAMIQAALRIPNMTLSNSFVLSDGFNLAV